jgi:hypothetical protein
MSRLGDRVNGLEPHTGAASSALTLASPDPDRNMLKSSMTIGLLWFADPLD